MSDIFDVTKGFSWRKTKLSPAVFRQARFHCEMNAIESGRRIVEHEFPKKELPYAEDMGRHAREFTVRAYCIAYQRDDDDLFTIDYTVPRDALINALEQEGPGVLQLNTQPSQEVVVTRYRMTEEERFGGYCTFDITFLEYGLDPLLDPNSSVLTSTAVAQAAQALRDQVQRTLAPPDPSIGTGLPTSTTSI